MKANLEKLTLEEERTLRMKSKFIWAKEGDAHSKRFPTIMNARKSKNVITRLELEDGRLVDSEEDIVREITGVSSRVCTRWRGCVSRVLMVLIGNQCLGIWRNG